MRRTPDRVNAPLPDCKKGEPSVDCAAVPAQLLELKNLVSHLGANSAARTVGVHRTTLGRWLAGQVKPPRTALQVLRMAAFGQVVGMGGQWEGWRFNDGLLWSPEGYQFTSGDLMAQVYERPLLKALRKQVAEYEARIVSLTKAAAQVDPAANDSSTWPANPATRAFSGGVE